MTTEHWSGLHTTHHSQLQSLKMKIRRSKALPVDDSGSRLVVLSLRDPHLLESAQGGQNGAPDPHGILSLWRCHDLDLHRRGSQSGQLLRHALADSRKHGGASRKHNVRIQIFADVHVALHDGLERRVVDSARLLADQRWLEKHLG